MSDIVVLKNIDALAIQTYQQNRPPLLFVDLIHEAIPGKSARGIKNFTFNEWYFPAHFADEPNVPGFVQVEALTQVFLMTFLTLPENKGKKTGFVSINNTKFKRKIVPGDQLVIEATLSSYKRGLAQGKVVSFVDGEPACQMELVVSIPDVMLQFRPKT